ncbi:MAG: DUF4270 family protein [Bacteroidota bacterium]
MNLWDRFLALLGYSFIPIALFLCACEAESDLGSEILDINSDSIETFAVSIPLDVTMQRVDTIFTNNNPNINSFYLVGKAQDPELGEITATTFAQLSSFQDDFLSLSDSDVFTSAQLVLIQNGLVFGPGENQEIIVREILEPITSFDENIETQFDRREEFLTSTDPIGQTFVSLDNDTLSIPINVPYGSNLFNIVQNSRDSIFANQGNFNQLVNGISIEGGESNNSIFEINSGRTTSFLELSYVRASDTTDTSIRIFLESLGDTLNNASLGFSQVLFDSSNPLVTNILVQPERQDFLPIDNKIVFNSLLGVFPKISFGNFCEWLETQESIIINNISIRIGIDGRDIETFPIPNIQLAVSDSSGMITDLFSSIDDGFISSDGNNFNLGFDANESEYVHSSTLYFEFNINCDSLESNFNKAFVVSSFAIGNERFFNLNLTGFIAEQENIFLEVIYTDLGN